MKRRSYKPLFLLLAMLIAGAGQAYADDGNKKGDANVDTNIDVADIVALRRKINLDAPPTFNDWAGDVNGDADYNVADIVAIRNIINYGSVDVQSTISGWEEGNTDEEQEEEELTCD